MVEEIADFGKRYKHGFEVGSKPEIIVALSTMDEPGSLIICNGYKDKEFIELGLSAIKLGFTCVFVVETPSEIPYIIECSRRTGIEPIIGVRVKTTASVGGHWNSTSGDRSVFGLTTSQLVELVDTLKAENMLHCLQLLHCHLGSQIPDIKDIRSGITEVCRYYADLVTEGAALKYIDLGGGLAVDYTGWGSTYGPIHQAVRRARKKGLDVSHVHVRHVWPLPRNLGDLLRGYDNVLVPEMNTGQFKTVLRDQYLVDAQPLNKVSGQPFTIAEIEAAIEGALA